MPGKRLGFNHRPAAAGGPHGGATLHPAARTAAAVDSGAAAPTLCAPITRSRPPMTPYPLLISLHALRASAGRVRLPPVICGCVTA